MDDEARDDGAPANAASEEATPTSPPLFVDRHGDVKMGWKILFLVLCVATGAVGIGVWLVFDWRGRNWNREHGAAWRSHLAANQRSASDRDGAATPAGSPEPA